MSFELPSGIDDLHARGKEFVTYDVISTGAFHAILSTKKTGKISIPFVRGSHVHKLCSLLRLRQDGIKR